MGVFGTWMTMSAMGTEVSASGWDFAQGAAATGGIGLKLPYVALIGGILAIVGALLSFAKPGIIGKGLLAIGGILALVGVAYGLALADAGAALAGAVPGVSMGAGYGAYLVVVGGILAILTTLGLKEE